MAALPPEATATNKTNALITITFSKIDLTGRGFDIVASPFAVCVAISITLGALAAHSFVIGNVDTSFPTV
jgi:hypothetical protein